MPSEKNNPHDPCVFEIVMKMLLLSLLTAALLGGGLVFSWAQPTGWQTPN